MGAKIWWWSSCCAGVLAGGLCAGVPASDLPAGEAPLIATPAAAKPQAATPQSNVQEPLEWSTQQALRALESPDSPTRRRARRWLLRRLQPRDQAALQEAALSGDVQSRLVLAEVLAAHPRHFDLAVALALHGEARIAEVGGWALEQSALAWNPALADTPREPKQWPLEWSQASDPTHALSLGDSAHSLAWDLDRLQHFGRPPRSGAARSAVEIVLDPELFPSRVIATARKPRGAGTQGAGTLRGTWGVVFARSVRAYRLSFEVWAWRPAQDDFFGDLGPEGTPFLLVRPRQGVRAHKWRGEALLADWMRTAAQSDDLERAAAAAQSLAQVGWPAAVAWLDRACLRGRPEYWPALCCSAGRGRLPRSLQTRAGVQALVAWLAAQDRSFKEGSAEAGRARGAAAWNWHLARRALQALPDVLEGQHELVQVLLAAGVSQGGSERSRWLVFEAFQTRPHQSSEIAALALEALEVRPGPSSGAAVQRSALGALANTMKSESIAQAGPGDRGGSDGAETVRLRADGFYALPPSARFAWVAQAERTGRVPRSFANLAEAWPAGRARLALWAQTLGARFEEAEPTVQALLGGITGAEGWREVRQALTPALAAGRASEVARLLENWAGQDRSSAFSRLPRFARLALGLVPESEARPRLLALLEQSERRPEDWLEIGLCAGLPKSGSRARGALIGALGQGVPKQTLGPALLEAMEQVRTTRDGLLIEEFEGDVRRAALLTSHPLVDELLEDGWGRPGTGPAWIELGADEIPVPAR